MDFKTQQNFHPVRSDLQPLPPGKGRLPSQPTSWLKLENSLFFILFFYFLREQGYFSLCALGRALLGEGGPVHSGEAGQKGQGQASTACLWGNCGP